MSASPLPSRPLAVRMVEWGVVLLALWNTGRAVALWLQADWLANLSIMPDSRFRLGMSLVWAGSLCVAAAGLRRRLSWSRPLIPLLLALYGVYELGMTLVFATSPPAPLSIVAYAVFVGLVGWALWRPAVGLFFDHDRQKGGR